VDCLDYAAMQGGTSPSYPTESYPPSFRRAIRQVFAKFFVKFFAKFFVRLSAKFPRYCYAGCFPHDAGFLPS
jgi:hypothetical protein